MLMRMHRRKRTFCVYISMDGMAKGTTDTKSLRYGYYSVLNALVAKYLSMRHIIVRGR